LAALEATSKSILISNNFQFGFTSLVNISSFQISEVSQVPVPAALPLFATILAGGGLIAWRRKRKAAKLATH
jgi:uncharacterized membrane protein YfcA